MKDKKEEKGKPEIEKEQNGSANLRSRLPL